MRETGNEGAQIGLQLYTLRERMKDNFVDTLKEISNIGYRGVEFAGYGNLQARELREIVQDLGLMPVSSHVALADLEEHLASEIEYAKELGLSYLVCPYLPEPRRQSVRDYLELAESLEKIGETCRVEGLTFCYHNHAFEFLIQTEVNEYALDSLFRLTQKEAVQAELDLYWIEYARESATTYLQKYMGRVPLVHVKDMSRDPDRRFMALGEGMLDLPQMVQVAKDSGTKWLFVEQDVCEGDPLKSVTTSYAYLTALVSMKNQK